MVGDFFTEESPGKVKLDAADLEQVQWVAALLFKAYEESERPQYVEELEDED